LHIEVEVLLMLNCEGLSFGGYCNTYNHNLPKRGVKSVKVHLHIISPFEIVLPIEMRRLSQVHGIEFFVRVVARKLCVVVGHFVEAGVSVLGFLFLDHLLEELLDHPCDRYAYLVVIMTIVVTSVVAAVVAVIITSIPVVIAMVGPAITIITSIRLTVTVVKALVTVPVVVVAAPGFLRGRRDPKSTHQLLALPHGMLSVAVELALVALPHGMLSVARTIVGRLVVGHEKARQRCPGGDALCWEIVEPQKWCLAHHKGEVSLHVVFIASRGTCRNAIHLEPYTWVRATVILLNGWFEVLGVFDCPKTS
jgi:hypothetical protein